jgi:hypothetical protein
MDGADLYQELLDLDRKLSASIKRLNLNGRKAAEAEAEYQTAKAAQILKLKDEGMAVGLITEIIRGFPGVAEKRLARDIEAVNYKVNQEYINILKLEIRTLDAQISREWGQSKGE